MMSALLETQSEKTQPPEADVHDYCIHIGCCGSTAVSIWMVQLTREISKKHFRQNAGSKKIKKKETKIQIVPEHQKEQTLCPWRPKTPRQPAPGRLGISAGEGQ